MGSYSERNTLEIDDTLRGWAELYFAVQLEPGIFDCVASEYDVEAFERSPGVYDVDFDCESEDALELDCGDLQFDIQCRPIGDRMSCDGSGPWEDYDFDYEKR